MLRGCTAGEDADEDGQIEASSRQCGACVDGSNWKEHTKGEKDEGEDQMVCYWGSSRPHLCIPGSGYVKVVAKKD